MTAKEPVTGYDPTESELAAERAVLGLAMLSAEACDTINEYVRPEDLYRPPHQAILAALLEAADRNGTTRPITVLHVLERRGELDRCGGAPYLHTLLAEAPPVASLRHHLELLLGGIRRRRTLEGLVRAQQRALVGDWADDPDAVAAEVENAFTDAVATGGTGGFQAEPTLSGGWEAHMAELEMADVATLPTGLPDLDRVLKIRPGDLVVVAARPGVGKSLMGLRLAREVAYTHGLPAYLASLEMTQLEVNARILAAEANVEVTKLLPGNRPELTEDDRRRLAFATERLRGGPLYIDATPSYSLGTLRSRLRRLDRRGQRPSLVVLDYLGLMSLPAADRHDLALGEATRQLKVTALEFEVPVIAIHQLNREVERRADKKPVLSDLHNSGAIEQHANAVLLLFEDEDQPGTV
ncbi:replicative DNA helicase, partial [Longimycelium tulufanense]|uniref:replicative DNA helicase n=1 Tax=Longimycelium tulufanense TaxID=907463 RepID=UPI00166611AE